MSAILGNVLGSVVRGAIIKEGIKSVGRGIKSAAKGAVRGVKSTVNKIIRGGKVKAAEIKSIPTGISRVKQMIKVYPEAWAKKTPYEKVTAMLDRVNLVRVQAGQKALTKIKQEELVRLFQKLGTQAKAKKSLRKILENATSAKRAGETWGELMARVGGDAKNALMGVVKGGAENVAVDQTAQLLGKGALGLGSGVVAGATTAAIIDKKK